VRLALLVLVACSARELPPEPRVPKTGVPDASVAIVPGTREVPSLRLPDDVTPLAYDVKLELDPESETFRGHVEIRVRIARTTDHVWLHAHGLAIATALADGRPLAKLAGTDDVVGFDFGRRVTGEVVLAFEYTGHLGRDAEGLFRQRAGGTWFLYAQAQAVFARRIVPCFDEPRWKPRWNVTLVVPKHQVALANGAQLKETALAGGRREVRFAEIAAMPSYLLSVAVGPFELVDLGTVGRGKVPVRAAVAPADAKQLGIVRDKLPPIVGALERYLDQPLPVAKLDLVAVPEFFGAMENVGLVTFDSSILVGDRRNPTAVRRFMRFAAHELAHQWFGNLVTPAWWDDLWLSEGLTTWLAEKVSDELGASEDPKLRAQLSRLAALSADDDADPRPLRRPILAGDDIDDRFDEIAYEKGGAVLDMIERHARPEVFVTAIRRYVTARAGGTATSEDFVGALRTVSKPAANVLASYLDLPGVPVVDLSLECVTKPKALVLAVRGNAKAIVPVCIRHDKGETCSDTGSGHIYFDHCPAWIIGNAGGLGYYRVGTPALAKAAPLRPTERLAHADDVAAAALRGELPIRDALAVLAALAAGDATSQLAALRLAEAIDPIVDDATRPAWTRWLAARFATRLPKLLGARNQLEYELRDRLPVILGGDRFDARTITTARTIVERSITAGEPPPEAALAIAAPSVGVQLFDRIVAKALDAPSERRAEIFEQLGWFPGNLAPRVVELFLDQRFRAQHVWPALERMLQRTSTRTAAWRAIRDRAPEITRAVARVELDAIIAAARWLCDASASGELTAFPDGEARRKAIAAIDRCVSRRTAAGNLAVAVGP
jgi:alanyl aminopeptidase